MSSPESWIFFDLGWTLVDETASHRARYERIRELMPEMAWPDAASFFSGCDEAAAEFATSPFRAVLSDLGLDPARPPATDAPYDHAFERLFPGVPELLDELSSGYRIGVIANQSAGTEARLRDFRIRDRFSLVVASAEVGLSKPDSGIFMHALAKAGCRPENATMVGDRLDNDIGPAKMAGLRTVRVLQGFSRLQSPRQAVEAADHTIDTIAEVPHCLNPSAA